MIQYADYYPEGHSDGIMHVKKFNLTDIGECEIQVFPYQDLDNPPSVYIVKDNAHVICSLRLDAPEYNGQIVLTEQQKIDINNAVNSTTEGVHCDFPIWPWICGSWGGTNDREETITLPDSPPDYTKM